MSVRSEHAEIPIVFISSTSEDLKKYREGARDAALGAHFHPEMMESFTVSGARPPLAECLAKASEVDVLVVIVAHRYGWVPTDQPADEHKNITWLECEQAVRSGLELLAFVVDDNYSWPGELREENQLVTAVRDGKATPELLTTVQRSVARLRDFKAWLNGRGIRALFTTPEDLRGKVSDALREWRSRHSRFGEQRYAVQSLQDGETFALQRFIIETHTRNFVGREQAQRELDHFLTTNSRGYFIVRGEPGQGKSALASQLVKTRGLIHHFVRRSGGRSDSRLILRSLLAQLIPLAQVEPIIPDTLPELVRSLENLIAATVSRQGQTVFVVDAIDELAEESVHEFPFLVTEGLPDGAFFVVTCRPGAVGDTLLNTLRQFGVPHQIHALDSLEPQEIRTMLQARHPSLTDSEILRIAAASEGNPLYLDAVLDELKRDPSFDLQVLPSGIEGFFQRCTEGIRKSGSRLRRDILGLLTVARKPLSLRELSEITGEKQRAIAEQAIQPIGQFLFELSGSYCFYHARFREFVLRQLLYEDELPDYHRLMADWLTKPNVRAQDYRWDSLAYHLYESGDRSRLMAEIDSTFLREKVRRCGYAVLEDVELLSRVMLEEDDPTSVPRCAALVEELRGVVGGDLIEDTRRAIQSLHSRPDSIRSTVVKPVMPNVPGVDVFVGMLPKREVGADFFELVPYGDRLVIAIGDAPGTGLRAAFVARFVGNLFRRLVQQSDELQLVQILSEIDRRISVHDFFERITMQCVDVDLKAGTITIANAGHPFPVLYSACRNKCDRLAVRGDCLHSHAVDDSLLSDFEQRRAEFSPGDVLVLFTDGLTEGHRLTAGRYGYRFTNVVEESAGLSARAIGEAVFDDWQAHPREDNYYDDVTVIVVVPNRSALQFDDAKPPVENA